jgi:hypothetical protein
VFRLLADHRRVLFATVMLKTPVRSRRDRPSIPVDIVGSDAGLAGSADFDLTAEPNESVALLALIAGQDVEARRASD